jgi:hypothetical protein
VRSCTAPSRGTNDRMRIAEAGVEEQGFWQTIILAIFVHNDTGASGEGKRAGGVVTSAEGTMRGRDAFRVQVGNRHASFGFFARLSNPQSRSGSLRPASCQLPSQRLEILPCVQEDSPRLRRSVQAGYRSVCGGYRHMTQAGQARHSRKPHIGMPVPRLVPHAGTTRSLPATRSQAAVRSGERTLQGSRRGCTAAPAAAPASKYPSADTRYRLAKAG